MSRARSLAADAPRAGISTNCRSCGWSLERTFVDLGMSPLANSYVSPERGDAMEPFYPLHVRVCEGCFLVQLEPVTGSENIFSDYAYFSSFSESWLEHARRYTEAVIPRFGLDAGSRIVEIASNDGYLLQYFAARGIPVLGVEPAGNVAAAAVERGIPTIVRFFDAAFARELAQARGRADLIVANNVLAHVPDLNGFVEGIGILLAPGGAATLEFPHLMRLIEENQFDTIYHEHLSYFSLIALRRLFERHGLRIFDLDELATHGGSLRIYVCHEGDASKPTGIRIGSLLAREAAAGLDRVEGYASFGERVRATKRRLLQFLIESRFAGKSIVGYGAPAKGNTLLNYCGVGTDLVEYTVDRSPHKQGRLLPGTRIPIHDPDRITETKPDYVLILPWNIREEVMAQMSHIRGWGGRFVVPIPAVQVYP